MLDRHPIFEFDPDRGSIEGSGRIAAFVGVAFAIFADRTRPAATAFEIGNVRSLVIVDTDQRSGKARRFRILRHDQRHWLTTESDLIVVKRTERRTGGRNLVA